MKKSVIVLSGGQDSTTCLIKAKQESEVVGAIFFDYNQRHADAEYECAEITCAKFNIPFKVVDVPIEELTEGSALTNETLDINAKHKLFPHLPASFVPGRNLIFLTLASAYAINLGAEQLWTGVCETDYSGYPDCRHHTVQTLADAIRKGTDTHLEIVTPLMYIDKAATFMLAYKMGELEWIIENTHTCYNGDHTTLWHWGYGCDECPACNIRREGFERFQKVVGQN